MQQWFPGWWSGTSSPTEELDGTESSFKEIDEEELFDELGLEMDGSSKLLRDRIFTQFSFHLAKGSLQLVTDESETESEDRVLKSVVGTLGSQPLLEIKV